MIKRVLKTIDAIIKVLLTTTNAPSVYCWGNTCAKRHWKNIVLLSI